MAQSRAESTRDTYNCGQYINQFPQNTIKVIREFERIQKKICRHKMSIMFNEICINIIYIYIVYKYRDTYSLNMYTYTIYIYKYILYKLYPATRCRGSFCLNGKKKKEKKIHISNMFNFLIIR